MNKGTVKKFYEGKKSPLTIREGPRTRVGPVATCSVLLSRPVEQHFMFQLAQDRQVGAKKFGVKQVNKSNIYIKLTRAKLSPKDLLNSLWVLVTDAMLEGRFCLTHATERNCTTPVRK